MGCNSIHVEMVMRLTPKKRINLSILTEMKNNCTDLTVHTYYGYQGDLYVYYEVNITDREYFLFMLKYGEYF
jgi:hypothetical protein